MESNFFQQCCPKCNRAVQSYKEDTHDTAYDNTQVIRVIYFQCSFCEYPWVVVEKVVKDTSQ